MPVSITATIYRLLPVVVIASAAMVYVMQVEGSDAYAARNMLPMLAVVAVAMLVLRMGGGRWTGAGWRWPLGTLGFSIPTIGLSIYLHYGYSVDLHGMYSESVYPQEVFRYLPIYTMFAGGIGFAIGWIAGRNV